VPAGVLELFAIPGLRPDKILKLYDALGVASLAELEAAAKEDRVRPVKGIGASLQIKILQNLAIAKSGDTQLHLHKAAALLEHAVEMAGLMLCLALFLASEFFFAAPTIWATKTVSNWE
jgi:DNA polymerase (family X)